MRTVFYGLLTVALFAAPAGAAWAQAAPRSDEVAEQRGCARGSFRRMETARVAYGAAALRRLAAYAAPNGRVIARFGRLNINRVPTVFGVIGARVDGRCRATWFRVRLPIRPNGSVGWVRKRDVTVGEVRTRIVVDLSARRVTLFRNGRAILSGRAAIGSSRTPTPKGHYYVNQRLIPRNPRGPYGPAAIGVSAFSNVLTGWAQGGPIGIHGTNRPRLLGRAISNGCVRLRNDVVRRMFRAVLAGTPVVIRA